MDLLARPRASSRRGLIICKARIDWPELAVQLNGRISAMSILIWPPVRTKGAYAAMLAGSRPGDEGHPSLEQTRGARLQESLTR